MLRASQLLSIYLSKYYKTNWSKSGSWNDSDSCAYYLRGHMESSKSYPKSFNSTPFVILFSGSIGADRDSATVDKCKQTVRTIWETYVKIAPDRIVL